jgi:hypothetical protein
MFDILKKTALPALAAVLTLAGAGVAGAQTLRFDADRQDAPRIGISDDGFNRDGMGRGTETYRRHERDRWERDGRNRSGRDCTPARALDKAERLGIRRARVVDVGRRTIDVAGRHRGERVLVTFARAPNCPVLR